MEELIRYCESKAPEEACGFILKDNTFIPVENIAEDKENYFKTDPREYLKYYKDIESIFHSHTKGQPVSDYDIKFCTITDTPWVVLILPNEFEIIYPEGYEGEELSYDNIKVAWPS